MGAVGESYRHTEKINNSEGKKTEGRGHGEYKNRKEIEKEVRMKGERKTTENKSPKE